MSGALDWLLARSLHHPASKPRFWLIVRLGRVVAVRKGQRMRSLSEKRYAHPDEARADADFTRRVAQKLGAGYVDSSLDLETAILHHEPHVAEMNLEIVRRAARELLAVDPWRHTLAAQALVRALGGTGDASDIDLARSLVARMDAMDAAGPAR